MHDPPHDCHNPHHNGHYHDCPTLFLSAALWINLRASAFSPLATNQRTDSGAHDLGFNDDDGGEDDGDDDGGDDGGDNRNILGRCVINEVSPVGEEEKGRGWVENLNNSLVNAGHHYYCWFSSSFLLQIIIIIGIVDYHPQNHHF